MVAKVEERKQNDPEKIVTYEKSKIFFFLTYDKVRCCHQILLLLLSEFQQMY